MGRFSIARSLRLALVGLAIALASVAAAGIASLYSARQSYENVLARSSDLGTAVANLTSAGVVQVEIAHDATGPLAPAARRQAAAAFDRSAQAATALAASDPASARLLARQISLQRLAVAQAQSGRLKSASAGGGTLASAATVADQLQARQRVRQNEASDRDRSKSRDAITIAIVAGVLALIAALVLIAGLVRSMRRPLDELVGASGELASGRLERRVQPGGPRELRELGLAFNAMADDLASAQRRIEDERRRLAVTIESLGDGLIVTESASSAIATMNPRAAELIRELAPGRSVDDPASPLPALHTALEREVVIDHAGRILAVTAAAMGDDTSSGIVWTVRDVTERARLERAKSDFVATASHELRSPLTSIKGFVELLERSPDRMSARQLEFLDIIKRSTDRLVELVNDLLDVARLEADHVEINARPIDVGEAVQELAELMGPRILAKHQTLGTYVAPTLPLAMADPERIRQVIGNLLTNAHLYTGEGGRIHVGVEADRAWVRIVVADTGIGMTRRGDRARLRALLPRAQRQRVGAGHGPRAVDRQVAGRPAPRGHRGRLRARARHHLPRPHPGRRRRRRRRLPGHHPGPARADRRRRARGGRAHRRPAGTARRRHHHRHQRRAGPPRPARRALRRGDAGHPHAAHGRLRGAAPDSRRPRPAGHADRVRVGVLGAQQSSRASGWWPSRSTPPSCARCSPPPCGAAAAACSSSGARSFSRPSSPRWTSSASSTTGRRRVRQPHECAGSAGSKSH